MQSGSAPRGGRIFPNQPIRAGHSAINEFVYKKLLESLDVGVAHLSPSGRLLYANRSFQEMIFGIDIRVGMELKKLISATSWTAFESALEQAQTGPVKGELQIESEHGDRRLIHLSMSPLRINTKSTTVRIVALEVTELASINQALRDSEQSVQSLSARLLRLQDDERRRIARELHDTTGQELAVILMSLTQLSNHLDSPREQVRQHLLDAMQMAQKVEDEVRTLSYVLHPPLLDEFGIQSALSWYIQGFSKRSGIHVSLEMPDQVPRLSSEKETALFRVVQEALSNVLRHSGSEKAEVGLLVTGRNLQLTIRDFGHGISAPTLDRIQSGKANLGVGIAGMRERIEQLGGSIGIYSNSHGTRLSVWLALDRGGAASAEELASAAAQKSPSAQAARKQEHKRVLIAGDHDVIREGVKTLLAGLPEIEVCGEAADGVEAVALAAQAKPDLVILDLTMPKAGGLSAAKRIRELGIPARILIFTVHASAELADAVRTGRYEGYVLKSNVGAHLVDAVRTILAGGTFFPSMKTEETGKARGVAH